MFSNKFFEIAKCTSSEAWKIRLWIIGIFTVLFFIILYSPFRPLFHYLGYTESTGCPFYTIIGIPCPTCGMGRGLWSIVHFDFANIFYHNPSAIFFYSAAFISVITVFGLSLFNYKVKLKKAVLNLWPYFIILIAVVWILNLLYGHA
jgi:hypothetical protein